MLFVIFIKVINKNKLHVEYGSLTIMNFSEEAVADNIVIMVVNENNLQKNVKTWNEAFWKNKITLN